MLVVNGLLLTGFAFAQTERFDIATFVPPKDWQRANTNGTVSFVNASTANGLANFCQITLFPSTSSTGDVAADFKAAWNNVVALPAKSTVRPKTEPAKTDQGWQAITGSANITESGITYTAMLVTATGFGRSLSVLVKIIGSEYLPAVSKFFDDLNLDAAAAPSVRQGNKSTTSATTASGNTTVNDYEFIAPPRWQVRNNGDHLRVQSTESGCLILIFTPQPSSGDLEKDARGVFETMYPGWRFQKSGSESYTLSKGYTPQGLEYFMMEAGMSKLSADGSRYDGFEDGAALVVRAGARIAIISVRHNSSLLAHGDCVRKYEYWRRFFNSFAVKNVVVTRNAEEDPAQRIVGRWSMAESGATGEYIFAANSNYAFIGAIGSSYTTRDYNYEYLHTKTYAFQGDGSYSIAGSQLTLKKRGSQPEQMRFRFDKVNRGGTGWKDRIYLLTTGRFGENEVSYEKQDK